MNNKQRNALIDFAAVANWDLLHDEDKKRWSDFIKEAKDSPSEIKDGDVFGVIKACNTNPCPDHIANKYEWLCRRDKQNFWRRFFSVIRELFFLTIMLPMFSYSAVQITDVQATPISPWAVKIDYRVVGGNGNDPLLFASNTITHQVYRANPNAIKGDFKLTEGRHSIRWNLMEDDIKWDRCNVAFEILDGTYCVIDLSAGVNASTYPVTYLSDIPSGGWKAEHKTTKLVLRLIQSGSFKMNGKYDVTITKPYYIGVFEVTQKQYQLVTGNNPSKISGDQRPVEEVSWNMIRGDSTTHDWPTKETVDSNSFVGHLRSRTGLKFDLPTEAQWEYACRAGATTTYSYGNSENGDYMWYGEGYHGSTHVVGTKLANVWGLYDMHGNVREWCLDWYGSLLGGTDPKGSSTGTWRVMRGGSYKDDASNYCTSSYRDIHAPSDCFASDGIGSSYIRYRGVYGFRIVRNLLK